jgi:hypothetical protein
MQYHKLLLPMHATHPSTNSNAAPTHPLYGCLLLLLCRCLIQLLFDPQVLKVHAKHVSHMSEVRVVTNDDRDVTVQLAAALPDEQVEEAVVHLGDQHCHALALRAVRDLHR